MSQLVLYKRDASGPSCSVMMLGHILDLKFEYIEPDLINMAHKTAEFKKMNPMGTIPVLQDGDFTVSESHAIMKYLLEKYGGDHKEKLYPSDVKSRAIVDQLLFFNAGVLFNKLKDVALPTMLKGQPELFPHQVQAIEDAYEVLEDYLARNKYVASDHMTLADLAVGPTLAGLHEGIQKLDPKRFPLCLKWLELVHQESCFKEINVGGVKQFAMLLQMFWAKNKELKQ